MLLTIETAMESLGLPVSLKENLTPALQLAISKAQYRLEKELDTKLGLFDYVDKFYVNSDHHAGVMPAGRLTLRLTNAWVLQTPAVVVHYKQEFSDTDVEILASLVEVDYERGFITLPSEYDETYVKVAYRAGFSDENEEDLNPNVRDALLAMLPLVWQAIQSSDDEKDTKEAFRRSGDIAVGMIGPGIDRGTRIAFYPNVRSAVPVTV